jgi:SAM-dependent methyltransferase
MSQLDEARRTSFDAQAELYDAVRPLYPDALADDVIARGGRRVLEIGTGTGQATVVFARRGASIVAIEPGPRLAAVLRREPLDQPERNRGDPAFERRPWPPDVQLAADEHRPCGTDLGRERRVALSRAREVVRALLAGRAVAAPFELTPHVSQFAAAERQPHADPDPAAAKAVPLDNIGLSQMGAKPC